MTDQETFLARHQEFSNRSGVFEKLVKACWLAYEWSGMNAQAVSSLDVNAACKEALMAVNEIPTVEGE